MSEIELRSAETCALALKKIVVAARHSHQPSGDAQIDAQYVANAERLLLAITRTLSAVDRDMRKVKLPTIDADFKRRSSWRETLQNERDRLEFANGQ